MSVLARVRAAQRAVKTLRVAPVEPPAPRPFGVGWVRKYLPHYFVEAGADFHGELFARLAGMHERRGTKTAVIAPREGAKSTITTLAYVLYSALEGVEPFALILSDSAGQAQEQLRHVRYELEGNEELGRDYPGAAGVGPVWRNDRLELRNGSVVAALGAGGRIRGRRARQARPSLIVLDDVQSNDAIVSQTKRARAMRWVQREVIPAGSAGTNFLSVGSALHREAVAVRLGELAGWHGRTFPAVHNWPARLDLWDRWEQIATNLADPDRNATADAFYEANREAMDAGAATYWPSRWPLVALMRRRAEVGDAAFRSEYQGVPATEGITEWPSEYFDPPNLWFNDWPADLYLRVQSLDPSKGADSKTGDYQGHVLVGLTRDGKLMVEADGRREQIPEMVTRAVGFAERSGIGKLDSLAVEDNDTLGMLCPDFERAAAATGRVVPLEFVRQTVNKLVRIRRLGIYFGRGRVRFRNTPGTRLLVEQLRDFPEASHDDLPDALELAVRRLELLTTGGRR